MTRIRRCSWETGSKCYDPATRRIRTTYLGQPVDRDVLMCDPHGDRADELLREGWAIVANEPLEPCSDCDQPHARLPLGDVVERSQETRPDPALEELRARRERLEDALGESSACNDRDCGCHRVAAEAREELEELDGSTVVTCETPVYGGTS